MGPNITQFSSSVINSRGSRCCAVIAVLPKLLIKLSMKAVAWLSILGTKNLVWYMNITIESYFHQLSKVFSVSSTIQFYHQFCPTSKYLTTKRFSGSSELPGLGTQRFQIWFLTTHTEPLKHKIIFYNIKLFTCLLPESGLHCLTKILQKSRGSSWRTTFYAILLQNKRHNFFPPNWLNKNEIISKISVTFNGISMR